MEDEVIATVIEQPAPMQIREPSVAAPEAKMTPQAPDPVERRPLDTAAIDTSPEAMVEDEPTGTPMEGTLVKDALLKRESAQGEGAVDDATLKAIEDAKNDFGRRAARQKAQPSIEEPLSTGTEETKSRKRPAPKVKKGQATVKKPPSKRRKVDDASPATTRRSLSPSRAAKPSMTQRATSGTRHGKKSKSNTPAPGSSPAPGSVRSASYVSADDDDAGSGSDGGDSNAAYCICRKGDNHTWMIACDGGCEDWFHGKCIDILEDDGELIDKYICPNCEKTNKSTKVTTWLPGCRNRGCRKPARIRRGDMSKYCSDKCGREFMAGELKRSEEVRRKANGKDSGSGSRKGKSVEINGDAAIDSDNDDLGPRGGTLKASELKALVTSTSASISSFRSLGGAGGVLSPPPSNASPPPDLTSTEKARLEAIGVEKDDLRRRRTLLKDREKFGQLVRENVARYAEREGVKPKDVCGYDNRLTWGEAEFAVWRDDADGAAALSSGVLELPEPKDKPEINGASSTEKMDIDNADPSSDLPPADTGSGVAKATLCTKKRCERHRQWQKQALADVRFEESQLADRMRELEAEERELREAAMLRSMMREGGLAGEGWVEVVGE
jgi:COMPASS component SPP1